MISLVQPFRTLQPRERRAFGAAFFGWALDAFDFFLLTFTLDAVAATFHVGLKVAATAIFWTLCMRPVGALAFGWLAERFGRRPVLMANILCFSFFEIASAFAPSFGSFLLTRALFGVAMGGEWGVGAALALETLPAENRGFFSGLLQEGYAAGNLLAAAGYGLLAVSYHGRAFGHALAPWRLLFVVGALPSLLLVGYIALRVEESPAWRAGVRGEAGATGVLRQLGAHGGVLLGLVLLMTGMTSLSHGTQDLYPTFLKGTRHLPASVTSMVAIVSTVGALFGGPVWGALSERIGRRRALAAASLLAIPVIPLWVGAGGLGRSAGLLAVGGFLMQFMVQGAWGIVPAHLTELSPASLRAVLPGFAYQLGNLLTARNAVVQVGWAAVSFGGDLAPVLGWTVVGVSVVVAVMVSLGGEGRGAHLAGDGHI